MTPISFKIWYDDGAIYTSREGLWTTARSTGLQVVTIFFAETYQTWVQDGWSESGAPINPQLVTYNYCDQLQGSEFYWLIEQGTTIESWGMGTAEEVPADLPVDVVKEGPELQDDIFWPLYNTAKEERAVP